MIGIKLRQNIGIGDSVQFTSLPENYYRATGKCLVDIENNPVFDFNPYIVRAPWSEINREVERVVDVWETFRYFMQRPDLWPRKSVFLSNAEMVASILRVPVSLNRPRLYRFESFPFRDRTDILLHVKGRSHGQLPERVVEHVLDKYGYDRVVFIGLEKEWDYDLPMPLHAKTDNFWELAGAISQARMFIGVDSGPSWVAQCYPDVVVKKVRLIPSLEELHHHVPLEICHIASYWDDRTAQVFNPSDRDVGFTHSYTNL